MPPRRCGPWTAISSPVHIPSPGTLPTAARISETSKLCDFIAGGPITKRARNDRSGWFNYHAYNYEKETLEWIADVIDNQNLVANKILASELTTALYFMHCSLAIQRLHKTTAPIPVLVFTYSHIAATTWTRISEFVFDNVSKTMTIRQSIASKIPQKYDDPIVHNIVRWMFPSRVVAAAAAAPGASTGASGALPHNVISGRATPTAQGSHGQTQTSSPPRATATPPPQQRQQGSTSHRGIPSRTAGSPSASSRPSSHASSTNSRPPSQASNQGTGKRPGPGELGYRI
ncbi:hypothetical protein B0H63DRAFT_168328 [Podospora didyma]|uniref:Uncharacterized protein n=1 Tax=Podospora didyma TaxID=330526 RepID=A0AAE0NUN2_9PEZI|nr:hypothetical protein B0H63DRAFT_168328 [Podospora didyma]